MLLLLLLVARQVLLWLYLLWIPHLALLVLVMLVEVLSVLLVLLPLLVARQVLLLELSVLLLLLLVLRVQQVLLVVVLSLPGWCSPALASAAQVRQQRAGQGSAAGRWRRPRGPCTGTAKTRGEQR
mgnify:CR=1 FL=1